MLYISIQPLLEYFVEPLFHCSLSWKSFSYALISFAPLEREFPDNFPLVNNLSKVN